MESQSSSKKREKKLLLGDKLSSWSFTIPLPSYLVLSFAFCYAVFRDILQWAIIISSSFLVGTQQTLVTPVPVYKECKCPYIYEVLDIIIWIKTWNIKENILSLFALIVWMLLRVVGYAIYLKGDEMWPCCCIHTPQNGKRKEGRKGFLFRNDVISDIFFFFFFILKRLCVIMTLWIGLDSWCSKWVVRYTYFSFASLLFLQIFLFFSRRTGETSFRDSPGSSLYFHPLLPPTHRLPT